MDNYKSTNDPLLNTQTCLIDPYIETSEGGHIRMNRGGGIGGRTEMTVAEAIQNLLQPHIRWY